MKCTESMACRCRLDLKRLVSVRDVTDITDISNHYSYYSLCQFIGHLRIIILAFELGTEVFNITNQI